LEQLDEIQELIGALMWVLIPSVLSLILAIILGVSLVAKKRLPLALHPLPVALPALAGWMMGLSSLWGWSPANGAEEAMTTLSAVSLVRLSVFMLTAPLCAVTLLFCAVAGARHVPRRRELAGVGLVLVVACSVLPMLGAVDETLLFGQVRGACYIFVGWMVVLAMLSGGADEDTGPDAAATAGICFALLVSTGESALRGLFEFIALGSIQNPEEVSERSAVVEKFYAVLAPELPFTWIVILIAAAIGVLGLFAAYRRGRPGRGLLVAGLWLLWPVLLLTSDIGIDRMTELALALP